MTRDQYGISAPVSQTSFWRETDGSVAKCGLFSQAIIRVNDRTKCLVTQGFYRTKLFVDRLLSVDRPLFQALSDGSKLEQDKQRAHNVLNSHFPTVMSSYSESSRKRTPSRSPSGREKGVRNWSCPLTTGSRMRPLEVYGIDGRLWELTRKNWLLVFGYIVVLTTL